MVDNYKQIFNLKLLKSVCRGQFLLRFYDWNRTRHNLQAFCQFISFFIVCCTRKVFVPLILYTPTRPTSCFRLCLLPNTKGLVLLSAHVRHLFCSRESEPFSFYIHRTILAWTNSPSFWVKNTESLLAKILFLLFLANFHNVLGWGKQSFTSRDSFFLAFSTKKENLFDVLAFGSHERKNGQG